MKNKIYKKIAILISIMLAFGLLLSGCAKAEPKTDDGEAAEAKESESEEESEDSQESSESEETATDEEEPSEEAEEEEAEEEEEPPFDVETANKRRACYAEVLRNFKNNLLLPDGSEVFYEGGLYGNIDGNVFGVYDVDGDGEEELIIEFSTAPMMGMFEKVYGYDAENDTVVEELAAIPGTQFCENGIAKVMISHNQGTGGKFWPYTVFKYNPDSKVYEELGFISAWDGEYFPEDYSGEPFPAEEDTDGDQMLYYIFPNGYDYNEEKEAINIKELETWLADNGADSEQISFDGFKLTDYNIDAYEMGDNYTLTYDDNYQKSTTGNLEFFLPKEFFDKVNIEQTEMGLSFTHKATQEFGEKYLNYGGYGWLGAIARYEDSSYLDLPGYFVISYGLEESYIMMVPTDVRFILPEYMEDAKANGFTGTEEDITALYEEYQLLYGMLRSIEGTIVK